MPKTPEQQFLADVADHKMTVKLDNGLYRHLHFSANSFNQWFDLVTWPGNLVIHGDMGTWAFARLPDMFSFFRSQDLKINASYWSEKLTAESRFGGPHRKFVMEVFQENVLDSFDGYDLEDSRKAEIIQALHDDLFNSEFEEDETICRRALDQFKHGDFEFSDTSEIDGTAYTHHFLWCLFAIVWGIQQYDAVKASPVAAQS